MALNTIRQLRPERLQFGLDQWRNFEAELQPLGAQLSDIIQRHEQSVA